ncbi:MAG: hypothetical protein WCS83_00495 [Endomicrobiia bacterium]|jgi:hypothetical protein|nr:hypothetical protein [Endomicrobiaceae bacterium]MDD3053363.1 hypothetical protein [Endomicrobiaceae bacterium]MDD3922287.1 hypothetical protein [Endomicrobiaceae bacterium]
MQIELSEREIELIVHMLTESVTKTNDGKVRINFSMDEIILLEKLEQSLKIKDIDSLETTNNRVKYLN